MWWLAGSWAELASPTSTMMRLVTSSSVAVSLGSWGLKRIVRSGSRRAPTTITSPSTSSALDEDRAEDRRLRRPSAGRRSARTGPRRTRAGSRASPAAAPVIAGAEALADLLGGERHDPGGAGQRERGQDERHHPRRPRWRSAPRRRAREPGRPPPAASVDCGQAAEQRYSPRRHGESPSPSARLSHLLELARLDVPLDLLVDLVLGRVRVARCAARSSAAPLNLKISST